MLFPEDIHKEGEEGGGPAPAGKGFEYRGAVKAEAAHIHPGDGGIAEIGEGLEQPQKPHAAKDSIALNKGTPSQRTQDAQHDAQSGGYKRDLAHQLLPT